MKTYLEELQERREECFKAESTTTQLNKNNWNSGECVMKVFENE